MEIHINFLSSFISNALFEKSDDSFLSEYFNIIEASDYFKIIDNSILYGEIFSKIEEKYCINKMDYINKIKFEKFVKSSFSSILRIEDKKNIIKMIPLIIYMDEDNLLLNYLLKIGFLKNLEVFFDKIISKTRTEFSDSGLSKLNWEVKSYNEYKEGVKSLNFEKIYSFVESMERGRGISTNKLVGLSVYCMYYISPQNLKTHLLYHQDTLEIITLICELSIYEKLFISTITDNIYLKIEALRNSIYMNVNDHKCFVLYNNEILLIEDIIKDISSNNSIWKNILNYFIFYPSRSTLFFKPIANVIEDLNQDALSIVINSIKLSQYFRYEEKTAVNLLFLNIKNEDIRIKMFGKIYENWKKYINEFSKYTNTVMLTSTIDVVLFYVQNYMSEDAVIDEVNVLLNDITEIENNWYNDETERTSLIYKYITKIFVFSDSVNTSEKEKFKKILLNTYELQNESKHCEINTLELFRNNTNLLGT